MEALTWFSHKQDTLYLSTETVNRIMLQDDLATDILGIDFSKVQRLLLGSRACECPHGFRRHDLLCTIIGWFGNLKHLTFVSEIQVNGELAVRDTLIDIPSVEDLKQLSIFYMDGYRIDKEVKLNSFRALSSINNQVRLTRDQQGISTQRHFWETIQQSPSNLWKWEMPIIDRQCIVSAYQKAAFDMSVEEYSRQKALWSINIHLTVWGGDNFLFNARHTSTVMDAIEAFRKARRYSKKRVINIEHEGKILDPEMKVMACEKLGSITFLNVVLG